MTVGAQQLQIGQAIVFSVSIDVMQRHAQRLLSPFGQPTLLAAIGLQSLVQEPLLQM
jgi:hypothetical protein